MMDMPPNISKLKSLEGLRGLAALVVVFTHLRLFFFMDSEQKLGQFFQFLPYPLARASRAVAESLYDGNFAVWTFWVMSSFVLSFKYFTWVEDAPKLAQRYLLTASLKRYFRLAVPVLVSVMLAYFLLVSGLMSNGILAMTYEGGYATWVAGFYAFDADFFTAIKSALWDSFVSFDHDTSYNAVLWTIEKEFFGSLFLFVCLALFGNRPSRWLWYLLIGIALALLRLNWVNAFVAGMLICDIYTRPGFHANFINSPKRILSHPAMAIMSAVLMLVLIGLPNYKGVFHLILASTVVVLCLLSRPWEKIFSSDALVFLGKISFGLYLSNLLVICSFSGSLYLYLSNHVDRFVSIFLTSLFSLVVSLIIGWVVYIIGDRQGVRLASLVVKRM
jgi:peptidoglycan/LPS O-acetylase OafA/YrhL